LKLRHIEVSRYITPLREGGSLPAIISTEDEELFVLKFRGAGQGVKALIAEVIGGELARRLGFLVPEIVIASLDESFGRAEPDEEIQDLLKSSTGLNLGIKYLQGAMTFDPGVTEINEMVASMIVWFDCFITNVDRTTKNTNMLVWNKELWLIDHGAALYFHHQWVNWERHATKPFTLIKDHVLLPRATRLQEANELMKAEVTENLIKEIIALIPEDWFIDPYSEESVPERKSIYLQYLLKRLQTANHFTKEIIDAGKIYI
jgi:hypothetical protein